MADADFIAFAPGWETSKGCQVEQDIAVRWDIKHIYL
jgi:hypothetical protein